jgi:ribosomal protein S18 acetylase RimI-like enzyme
MPGSPHDPIPSFFFCDFTNEYHRVKLLELIDHYITDPMGNGLALSLKDQENLLEGLKNHPASMILFIAVEKEIVGLATCFINFSTFKAMPYLNIHDLVVHREHRGRGLARKILDKCIEIAQNRGYCKVTLEVREDNEVAKSLYKHLGFKDSEPPMHFWTKTLTIK